MKKISFIGLFGLTWLFFLSNCQSKKPSHEKEQEKDILFIYPDSTNSAIRS